MLFPLRITEKITLLGSELFNLYLIRGQTCAIIEGGISAMTHPFLKQLTHLNVPPETISHLVILHSHFDHMMVFATLKERYPWMKIVSSERNRSILSSEKIVAKIFDTDRQITSALMERGLISEAPDLKPSGSFPLDITVREGANLDLGNGIKITFIETPGHSPDGLSAYFENEAVLFCSDGSGFYIPPNFFRPNYWFRLDEAEKSLDRMKAIDPNVLCRGHYGAIVGRETTRQHLRQARQSIEDFKILVLERVQSGASVEAITAEVTERFSKGLLELFPPEKKYRLWKLLIRRTLEYFGIEIEGMK